MVRYLRTCLAKSCGVSSLHTTDISDWMEQAPIISHYSSARRQSGQRGGSDGDPPTKQLKSETEGVVQSLRQYADLLTQCISVSTSEFIGQCYWYCIAPILHLLILYIPYITDADTVYPLYYRC